MLKIYLIFCFLALSMVLPCGAQVVQAVSLAGGYGTSISKTISGVVAGNAIFAYVAGGTSATSYSISDKVNTYTTVLPFNQSTSYPGVDSQAWVATGVSGGNYTVTVTFNGGGGGPFLILLELSGLASSPFDQSGSRNSSGGTLTVGPVSTTSADEILIGTGYSIDGAVTLTPGSGYAIPANGSLSANVQAAAVEYQVVSSIASYSATMLESANANSWTMHLCTLKLATQSGGGGGVPAPPGSLAAVPAAVLVWTSSTSAGVTENNVYRSSTSGGPYTPIGNVILSGATTQTFLDLNVVSGQTYYYVVTALVGTVESAYSNQVTTTVP
jgi:hypothetical protein